MRRLAPALALLASTTLWACKPGSPGVEGDACSKKEDCAEGLSCLDNVCTKLASGEAPAASSYCATVADLAGAWVFDTLVIGAEDLAPRGINGHYEMTVVVDHCAASIGLIKTGYDDVRYSASKIQSSEAVLAESTQIPGAAEATVSLKGKPTHTMTFVVSDGQLFGSWQMAGDEWARAGMWGTLRGIRRVERPADEGSEAAEQPEQPEQPELVGVDDFAAQPCEVRCLASCDAARRRVDATLDEPALAACMTACGGDEPIAGCGGGSPLPEELVVNVKGPAKSLDELCSKATAELLAANAVAPGRADLRCDRKPVVKDKAASRSLSKAALGGSFLGAQLLQVGYFSSGYVGHHILALETEAGWFWTDSLADVSMPGTDGISVTTTSLVLRARELLSAALGREVVAEIAVQITDSDLDVNEISLDEQKLVVVCSTGSPPTCMRVPTSWSSRRTLIDDKTDDPKRHPKLRSERGVVYLAFLPGDRVSISTPADARAADRELSGIYVWPP
jgi:hypothetical protein